MAEDVKLVMRYRVEANAPLAYQKPILLMEGDKRANVLQISLFDGEKAVDLTGLNVGGSVLRADGADVAIEGEIDGNVISCVLSEYAYAVAGPFKAFVQLLDSLGDVKRTVLLLAGMVESRGHGPQIDTGKELPSLDDILAQLETMRNVTQAANTAAGDANTAAAAANSAASKATGAANSATTAAGTANAAADRANDAAQNWEEGTVKNAESLGGVPAASYALKTDTAPNAEMLGGKAPGYYIRSVNLLDNSDFRNPVNQRGQTSYTENGYTIDRWRTWSDNIITEIKDGYLYHTEAIYQYVEGMDKNKVYTFAVKNTDGEIIICSGKPIDSPYNNGINIQSGVELPYVRIWGENQVKNIEWACLYEGTYTAETLPPYVPKGYAAELAECQRYYRRTGAGTGYSIFGFGHASSTVEILMYVPKGQMRIEAPTFSAFVPKGAFQAYNPAGSVDITSLSADQYSGSYWRVKATVSGATSGEFYYLRAKNDLNAYIEENADL